MKRVRFDQPSDLIRQQSRGHVQQAKPFGNPAGLGPIWIGNASPQHLVTAAYSDHLPPPSNTLTNGFCEPRLSKIAYILNCVLVPWKRDDIGSGKIAGCGSV